MKSWIVLLLIALTACGPTVDETPNPSETASEEASSQPDEGRAKFEPPDGHILVFAGQSNDAVGGHDQHDDGYVDHFGVPAGFSHYVGFLEGVTTPLGYDFDEGRIEGLSDWDYWGAGPMCLKCYLDDPDFAGTFVHLALSMENGSAERLAQGEPDVNVEELAAFLETYSAFPFFLRIGYEFDGEWNAYEPEAYKAAYRRIVDELRAAGMTNFATVFASSHHTLPRERWEAYYPGPLYVDWLGYSWWGPAVGKDGEEPLPVAAELAREWDKPLLMAEVGPRHYRVGQDETEKVWAWYESLFQHIEEFDDVVKGLAIINNHWDPEPMWKDGDWGDFRLQQDPVIQQRWQEKMSQPPFIHRTDGLYELIRFSAE